MPATPCGDCPRATPARERLGTQIVKRAGRESVLESLLFTGDGPVAVSAVTVDVARAANLPRKAAGRWVNRSLWRGTGIYHVTQAWAALFDRAGFDGLCYEPRFTTGRTARALAAGCTVISEATWQQLTEPPEGALQLSPQLVKGRVTPVTCYRLPPDSEDEDRGPETG